MKKIPKVFIIVLNYNGNNYLNQTLLSLLSVDYPNFETILVDNGSTDESFEKAKISFPKIKLIKNTNNLGFSAGNNVGIKYALERGAEYVLLLNNDTLVKNDFLSKLVYFMEENKKIGITSPKIFTDNFDGIWFAGGKINWLKMKTLHEKKSPPSGKTDFISGCAMFIRTEVFKKIGLLDEDYFLYWEDVDFSLRAKKAGYKLSLAPEGQIAHLEKSTQNNGHKNYWLVISGLIFFRKNSPLYLKPWIIFYSFLRKIKNRLDVKNKSKPETKLIQKAYNDFKKFRFK